MNEDDIGAWCSGLLEQSEKGPSFDECLDRIPTLESIGDLPPRTRVLIRCDTNVALDAQGEPTNASRLLSLIGSLQFGRERGWIQIIHGHIGTRGRESLLPVAGFLGRQLGCDVELFDNWMSGDTGEVHRDVDERLRRLRPGDIAMLENARRYDLETCLWRPRPVSLSPFLKRLTRYVISVRERLATVHVNEGFAASNCDLSSALVPCGMDRVALGLYVAHELKGPVRAARAAEAVVFSGAKFNKFDDLEEIVRRNQVRLVIAGGLLAMPFLKAREAAAGRHFETGCPEQSPADRYAQARRLLCEMATRGIEILLPVDFVLEDGAVVETIPAGLAQRDAGPQSRRLFEHRLRRFARDRPGSALFHNGVFGQFERPEFAAGTREHFRTLHELHETGMRIYVGGGEGGTALHQLGDPLRVTHCFTAGTTILKALGQRPIPYLWALQEAAMRHKRGGLGHAV